MIHGDATVFILRQYPNNESYAWLGSAYVQDIAIGNERNIGIMTPTEIFVE
jgi:hypothetical protein